MSRQAIGRELDLVLADLQASLSEADRELIMRVASGLIEQHGRAALGLPVDSSLAILMASVDQIEAAGERIGRRIAWGIVDRLLSHASSLIRAAVGA